VNRPRTPLPAIPRPASGARDGGRQLSELFATFAATPAHTPAFRALRDELVERNLPLAYYLARRFAPLHDGREDLRQVATIGLIKAVDRFDPTRGVEFTSYATPTVLGELKRHLRDRGWALRLPRRLQENVLAVTNATGDLVASLARSPTIPELAVYTGLSDEAVLEALESQRTLAAVSLDGADELHFATDTGAARAAEAALEQVENRAWVVSLLRRLNQREREIVVLRFFANMTQSQIATAIGVSQMHVSRLLARSLQKLRGVAGLLQFHALDARCHHVPVGRRLHRLRSVGDHRRDRAAHMAGTRPCLSPPRELLRVARSHKVL
jgi:RNA polymerase sigma-B factor